MIFLPLDEAYALDYFSILCVKAERGLPVAAELERIKEFIRIQCPQLDAVLASREYFALHAANRATFDAIDAAHHDTIKASAVQRVNRRRYLAKRRLQARFWPTQPLAEQKTR